MVLIGLPVLIAVELATERMMRALLILGRREYRVIFVPLSESLKYSSTRQPKHPPPGRVYSYIGESRCCLGIWGIRWFDLGHAGRAQPNTALYCDQKNTGRCWISTKANHYSSELNVGFRYTLPNLLALNNNAICPQRLHSKRWASKLAHPTLQKLIQISIYRQRLIYTKVY